ncbi:O-antigen polymerase [Bifidobacterium felsineum]|uniref:O-antigen polymerase n=1 Tax=Bifidobacterium felsineum TaxID=2045440 RepID=UPI001BDC5781|nr:O-antigen polymerase [Bifidobacterium felsineum]MBT1164907.1 oligosaccharide repeat unit polymerase [Bifidobacterium felsineum]
MIALILFIFLSALTIISFKISNGSILAPASAFCLSFALSVLNGLTNYNKWDFELHAITFSLIGGSAVIFCISCFIFNLLYSKSNYKFSQNSINLKPFFIPNYIYIIFLVLQLVSTYLSLKSIKTLGTIHGSDGTLSGSIFAYRTASLYSSSFTGLPGYVTFLSNLCSALGYICIYNAMTFYFQNKKINFFASISSFIAIIAPLVYGGRGASLLFIFFIFTIFLVRYESYSRLHNSYRILPIFGFLALVFIIAYIFYISLSIMGRSSGSFDFYYYLSIYLGAPIKNLDIYLSSGIIQPSFDCVETCSSDVYTSLNGISSASQSFRFTEFQNYNGFDLGNAYTIFHSFIHDFGFLGCILLIVSMALISQYFYIKTSNIQSSPYNVIYLYIYSMIFYSLCISFFSNQFYKTLFSTIVLKYILIWFCFGFAYRYFSFNKTRNLAYIF